jgi:hypothetical protein
MPRRSPVALRFQKAPDGRATLFLGVHAYKETGINNSFRSG